MQNNDKELAAPADGEGLRGALARLHSTIWPRAATPLAIGLLLALAVLLAMVIVGDFSQPLFGSGDVSYWLHDGTYFARHIEFGLVPRLDFHNDSALYPYGVSQAFQPWAFEPAYFYAAGYTCFGHGPWLQWYYLLSVCLTAAGVYVIGRREFGAGWALTLAVALSFGNFYAHYRFPIHLMLCLVHWMTFSLLLDLVILRRFVYGQRISARLLLLKSAVLALCFGLELGYVCGVALTSTFVTAGWIAVLTCWRLRFSKDAWRTTLVRGWSSLWRSAAQHKWWNAGIALAFLAACWLYLPIVAQLLREVKSIDTDGAVVRGLWTNPLRMFFPIVPGLTANSLTAWLHDDSAERMMLNLQPGICFVLLGMTALVLAVRDPRARLVVAPFLLMLVLLAVFHPAYSPLTYFPWFSHARSNNRFSLALPFLFMSFALALPASAWKLRSIRGALVLGVVLFAIEMTGTYAYLYGRPDPRSAMDEPLIRLTRAIAQAPGEAVMEWPFRVNINRLGGFHRVDGMTGLQAFHGKKMMGGKFGRVYRPQVQPLFDAGWDRLMFPNAVGSQDRDFTADEWVFLEEFFRRNDFCGIIVYPNLLPAQTVRGFHERFGEPVACGEFGRTGKLEFIPKREAWREDVDRQAGLALKFEPQPPVLAPHETVAFTDQADAARKKEGRADVLREGWSYRTPQGCWSDGKRAELGFRWDSPRNQDLTLELDLTAYRDQTFSVHFNGSRLQCVDGRHLKGQPLRLDVPASLLRPQNRIVFELPNAHTPPGKGPDGAARRLGVFLKSLKMECQAEPPLLHPHDSIEFATKTPEMQRALLAGWSFAGPGGRWTDGKRAELEFRWAGPTDQPLVLEFEGDAFDAQPFSLYVNGMPLPEVNGFGPARTLLRATVPAALVGERNRIVFELPHAHAPPNLSPGQVSRQLGVHLKSMKVYCLEPAVADGAGNRAGSTEKVRR